MTDSQWRKVKKRIVQCEKEWNTTVDFQGIDLSNAQFANEVFRFVVQRLRKIEVLNLRETHLTDKGLKALLKNVRYLGGLTALHLDQTRIGDSGLKVLAAQMKHLCRLSTLGLRGTQVGDEGLKVLAVKAGYRSGLALVGGSLSGTRVGDDGLKTLAAEVEFFSMVSELNIDDTQIGDEELKSFVLASHSSKPYTHLNCEGTRVKCLAQEAMDSSISRFRS